MNNHQRNIATLSRIQLHRDAQTPVDGWEEEQLREEAGMGICEQRPGSRGCSECEVREQMEELKQCPFCGGDAILNTTSNIYYEVYSVACTGELDSSCAGLEGTGFRETKEEVIAAWNKRVRT